MSKGKGLHLTCHAVTEGRDIALLILNLGARWQWVVNSMLRPLYPQEGTPVPNLQQAGRAPGPVWTFWRRENLFPQLGSKAETSSPSEVQRCICPGPC
jgi:hypothetical protein